MVEEITSFRASNGTIHDNAHNAWRAELTDWFAASGDVTEASAKKLVDRIAELRTKERDDLIRMIGEVIGTAPAPTSSIPAHGTADRYALDAECN